MFNKTFLKQEGRIFVKNRIKRMCALALTAMMLLTLTAGVAEEALSGMIEVLSPENDTLYIEIGEFNLTQPEEYDIAAAPATDEALIDAPVSSAPIQTIEEVQPKAASKKLTLGLKQKYTLGTAKQGKKLTFKSSKAKVASVNKKGVITAKKKGSATITVYKGKKKVGTWKVKVVAAPKKVTLKPKTVKLTVGERKQLTATLTKGSAASLTWKSSKTKVASVDKNGVVTAKKKGTATVTVKTHNGKTAKVTVKVVAAPEVTATPVAEPTTEPTVEPTAEPTAAPTTEPTPEPIAEPTPEPTAMPTATPAAEPTATPTAEPTATPTAEPTTTPTAEPMTTPTTEPTTTPTVEPTATPIAEPTATPTAAPTEEPEVTLAPPTEGPDNPTPTTEPTDDPNEQEGDFIIEDGVVTDYRGEGGAITVPSVDAEGNTVTAIGMDAFAGNVSITSVIIPGSVVRIGKGAFRGCKCLTKVDLSDGMKTIEEDAFAESGLSTINLPHSIESIAEGALPEPGTVIIQAEEGDWAYTWAIQKGYITTLDYPESMHPYTPDQEYVWTFVWPGEAEALKVVFSDETSFARDDETERYDILTFTDATGESIQYVKDDLKGKTIYLKGHSLDLHLIAYPVHSKYYEEGYGLKIVKIEPVTLEEYNDFMSRYELLTEELGDGTLKITGYKGPGRDLEIPATIDGKAVTAIAGEAFYKSNIRSIVIPDTVTYIQSLYCPSLEKLVIPDSVEELSVWALAGCENMTELTIPGTVYVGGGRSDLFDNSGEGNYPAPVKLSKVTISNSGTSLDVKRAFRRARNLMEYNVLEGNTVYSSYDGGLYNAEGTKLIKWPNGRTDFVLREGVTEIEEGAFVNCWNLSQVKIPDNVTVLGNNLFGACANLKSVKLPDRIDSIGDSMFYNCDGLTDFEIPSSVLSIGQYAFGDCDNLVSVTIPATVTEIGDYAFQWCSDELVIYGQAGSCAETYAAENGITFVAVDPSA